jgi:hypothetical protein
MIRPDGVCRAAVRVDGAPIVGQVWNPSGIGTRGPRDEDRAPFFLLEPGDALVEADVAALEAAIAEVVSDTGDRGWARGSLPSDAGLVVALESPNAGVREAAARLVRAGGATLYPQATARLRR